LFGQATLKRIDLGLQKYRPASTNSLRGQSGDLHRSFHRAIRSLRVGTGCCRGMPSPRSIDSKAATRLATSTFDIMKSNQTIGRAEALRRAMLAYLDDRSDIWNDGASDSRTGPTNKFAARPDFTGPHLPRRVRMSPRSPERARGPTGLPHPASRQPQYCRQTAPPNPH
jgi:hypothetical protein